MGQILEVRLQDGSTAQIDQDLISGETIEGVSLVGTSAVVDTGFAPAEGAGAYVILNSVAYDATGNLAGGSSYALVLRTSEAGVLVIAASNTVRATIGDSALTADMSITFSVSSENTLVVTYATTGYANPVQWIGVLQTGANTDVP
jgi:hypothetical protein